MDYRYLKAFLYTARYSSFSKAAEKLQIAQSAVSRQIKLLEEDLGHELIIRSSKKIILTQKGKDLYIAGRNFGQSINEIFLTHQHRELRVAMLQGLLKNWFRPLLIEFSKKYERNITVKIGTPSELKRGLEAGEFDLVFTTENIQSELISSLKIFNEDLVLISKNEIDVENLEQYRWIVYGEKDYLFEVSKKESQRVTQVENLETIIDLVDNNLGIAIVPAHSIKERHKLKITPIKSTQMSEIYMASLNYKSLPLHIKELAQLVQEYARASK